MPNTLGKVLEPSRLSPFWLVMLRLRTVARPWQTAPRGPTLPVRNFPLLLRRRQPALTRDLAIASEKHGRLNLQQETNGR
jgi:hypothetical protein